MNTIRKDLSGKTCGALYIICRDTSIESKHVYYKVKCIKCGAEYSVRADSIRRNPNHCKFCKYPDLTGMRFGYLYVVGYSEKKDQVGHKFWHCRCDCGKEVDLLGTNLIEGKTVSCGCMRYEITSQKELLDISGYRFGKLVAVERVSDTGERSKWRCMCDCGCETIVASSNLRNGHTRSCGCITSTGEYLIREMLNSNNMNFKTQYSFSDLPKRRFDFALFDSHDNLLCLIEFDGRQHYEFSNTWYQSEEDFLVAIERDKEKDEYCKSHDITLFRIRYDDILDKKMDEILSYITERNKSR